MLLRAEFCWLGAVGAGVVALEYAKPQPRREKMDNRLVDKFLAHEPFADGLCERVERLAALYVEPIPDSPRARALGRLLQRMAVVDVRDRAAVANDMAAKAELAAKNVLQQKRARARTLSVDSVVCAHDGLDAALLHKCAERRKIRFIEIAL